jgi:hypothetical protein
MVVVMVQVCAEFGCVVFFLRLCVTAFEAAVKAPTVSTSTAAMAPSNVADVDAVVGAALLQAQLALVAVANAKQCRADAMEWADEWGAARRLFQRAVGGSALLDRVTLARV